MRPRSELAVLGIVAAVIALALFLSAPLFLFLMGPALLINFLQGNTALLVAGAALALVAFAEHRLLRRWMLVLALVLVVSWTIYAHIQKRHFAGKFPTHWASAL